MKQQHTASRHKQRGFVAPGSQKEKLSSRVLDEADKSLEYTLTAVRGNIDGLTATEAANRLIQFGPNEVTHDKPPHALIQLLQAFKNPFVMVLIVLGLVSYVMDVLMAEPGDEDWVKVIILGVMVGLSGLLRFWQEYRSAKAAEALKSLVRNTATVQRRPSPGVAPQRKEVAMTELVAGDIVHLQAGDMIPADIKLIESRDLFISQAVLTGEALPVEKYDTLGAVAGKSADGTGAGEAGMLDLPNICFMGTNVVSGTARAVVVATGSDTYFGSLARNVVSHKRIETSFDRGVNSVTRLLIRFMLVMVPIVFMLSGVSSGDWMSALTFALAVAVGLTPEMLPMIVSANLARGAVAMAKRKVVVKRLNSVQNFGAMDVLCTDKTGTLTQDKIILEHHYDVRGNRDDRILQLAWLNSFHQSGMKNLMDIAVVEHADALGESCKPANYRKVDELPFDFVRRRLSVIVQDDLGQQLMVSKGAVEEMLAVSSEIADGQEVRVLTDADRRALLRQSEEFNAEGYRVLIVATREIPADECKQSYQTRDEAKLVVRGFLTFFDPPKDSAAPAIRALNEYGVAVKVLTGDNPIITSKVCRDVGLAPGVPLLGKDIEGMDDVALCEAVKQTTIFAKLTPLQKSRVVKALQANGNTVGFLGDGINDAPALRDADVGISVDSGADIAKETADIILLEKSLMVLEEGVIKGRETFGNILKYLNMTASSNFGNVFSVLVASAWLPWAPMLAMQMLIQNLVYDVSQMLLPWDKMDPEFLKRPRKWEASNIKRFMLWLGPTSSVFDISTYCLMWFVFGAGALYATANGSMDPLVNGQAIMNSGWFIEGLVSQTLVVHMLRTRKIPFLQSTATLPVLLSTSIAIAIGCYLPFSPLAEHFGFITLDGPKYFMWLVITMLAYMGLTQTVKSLYIKRHGQWF
ncbi:magnesium-translocating P-type ATPase [Aeromonas dhakensis]|uniref:magnesium-translocating P-type ATPase n=1 Tax=Aeromonas dhakensis TaxID=196024 RepID=UPI00191CE03F|nr:magnesium-translocating P-type ATPase [Aeromonas dhakensis]MBL0676914.1 magnesium-translocating P-type ATPase [Aeromonas dhakensis]